MQREILKSLVESCLHCASTVKSDRKKGLDSLLILVFQSDLQLKEGRVRAQTKY